MISEIIKKPENRRLEFKREVPDGSKLAESVIAFSNGAGGEIYIGVQDSPREIIGIDENSLFKIEEKISNIIYDYCYPTVIPDIAVFNYNGLSIIRIKVYPGGQLPYYLKNRGKNKATIIRVGSSNRTANEDIILELERRKRNISFDSVLNYDFVFDDKYIEEFSKYYQEKTGKVIDTNALMSLQLINEEYGNIRFSNALILLCNKDFKSKYFPYSKVECARFKGITTEIMLDQATYDGPIFSQPDEVLNFIKRNIANSSKIDELYRTDRWEYPVEAIREAVVNAVIHRDYSVLGSDIKVAIFDDMLEITNPGPLLPSINPDKIEDNPSELRNRVLGPIFKDCGMIEQWGSGFKKILEMLKDYPEIELKFNEPSNSFQIQFIKKYFEKNITGDPVNDPVNDPVTGQVKKVLNALSAGNKSSSELRDIIGIKHKPTFRKNYLHPARDAGFIEYTIPENSGSRLQKYRLSDKGRDVLIESNQK